MFFNGAAVDQEDGSLSSFRTEASNHVLIPICTLQSIIIVWPLEMEFQTVVALTNAPGLKNSLGKLRGSGKNLEASSLLFLLVGRCNVRCSQ